MKAFFIQLCFSYFWWFSASMQDVHAMHEEMSCTRTCHQHHPYWKVFRKWEILLLSSYHSQLTLSYPEMGTLSSGAPKPLIWLILNLSYIRKLWIKLFLGLNIYFTIQLYYKKTRCLQIIRPKYLQNWPN